MQSVIDKIKNFIKTNYIVILFICSAALFLILLNTFIWPTPDEYFYATIAEAFEDVATDKLSLSQLNTEHTYLVSFIYLLYKNIFHVDTLANGRLFIILYSIGIMLLLYLVAKEIKIEQKKRIWFLWLLLLVPGFWIFSVRLMLDIPAAFCILLIIYFLVKKSSLYKLSLALLLLLITKEYYIFLIFPLTFILCFFDIINNEKKVLFIFFKTIKTFLILFLPCLVVVMILVDINYLPYPRLLENNISYLFGDLFYVINKVFINVLNFFTNLINTVIFNSSDNLSTDFNKVVDRVNKVKLIGDIPGGFKNIPDSQGGKTLMENFLLSIKANYGDDNINLLLLSFAVTGIAIKLKEIFKYLIKQYDKVRVDVIFFGLFLAYLVFGLYEMKHVSTFRVVLPIIFAFIYFGYFGLKNIFENNKYGKKIFFVSTLFFILLYWLSFTNVEYTSILSKQGLFSYLFTYKHCFFIILYLVVLAGLLFIKKRDYKKTILIFVFIFFILSRFVPLYIDNKLKVNNFGYDYSANIATDQLQKIRNENVNIYSNYNHYKVQYYSNDTYLANEHCNSRLRIFSDIYSERYFNFNYDVNFIYKLIAKDIKYLFIVDISSNKDDFNSMIEFMENNKNIFLKVEDYYHNNKLQWSLYRFKTNIAKDYLKEQSNNNQL